MAKMPTVSRLWLSENFRLLREIDTFSLRYLDKTVNVFSRENKIYPCFVLLRSPLNPYSLVAKIS